MINEILAQLEDKYELSIFEYNDIRIALASYGLACSTDEKVAKEAYQICEDNE
jgi:hypothetical protein